MESRGTRDWGVECPRVRETPIARLDWSLIFGIQALYLVGGFMHKETKRTFVEPALHEEASLAAVTLFSGIAVDPCANGACVVT